ncbi:MAG: hypothetical protein FJ137_10655 [Deltaproteobacteria bacterium]|nr:hypothetical protein [Deltaproteobacteria bacterium]
MAPAARPARCGDGGDGDGPTRAALDRAVFVTGLGALALTLVPTLRFTRHPSLETAPLPTSSMSPSSPAAMPQHAE